MDIKKDIQIREGIAKKQSPRYKNYRFCSELPYIEFEYHFRYSPHPLVIGMYSYHDDRRSFEDLGIGIE